MTFSNQVSSKSREIRHYGLRNACTFHRYCFDSFHHRAPPQSTGILIRREASASVVVIEGRALQDSAAAWQKRMEVVSRARWSPHAPQTSGSRDSSGGLVPSRRFCKACTFNDCQLGTLHSNPRSSVLFVWLSAITFNNRPLVT